MAARHNSSTHKRLSAPAIGLLIIELHVPGIASLKEKRGVVKPLLARLRKEFNVAVAEVDDQDQWGHAVLAVVAVSANSDYVHGLLTQVAESVAGWRLDAELVDYSIELL